MPGLERGEPPHVLQVERVEEEEPAERGEGGDGDDARPRRRERTGRSAGRSGARPARCSQTRSADQRHGGHGEGAQDQRRRPAPTRGLDDAVGERGQEGDHEHLPGDVDLPGDGGLGLGDVADGPGSAPTRPMGMLIQKIDRHPTEVTSTPPTPGPAPWTPRPRRPRPRWPGPARGGSVNVLVMIDMATGLSIDPPTAWTMRKTMSSVRLGARLHSSEPADEGHQPDEEGAPTPEAVGGRAGEHEQAGQHQGVGVHRPLQAR